MSYCFSDKLPPIDRQYHDEEWGVPVHEDKKLFEYLFLECMQCGLSWSLMLKKREIFRACFDGFDVHRIATYKETDVERILATDGMIRSPRKVQALIQNARCFEAVQAEFGSFACYLWGFVDGKSLRYEGHGAGVFPVSNALSETISKALKKRGFRYVGGVTIYSYLQACGIINDHEEDCPRCRYLMDQYSHQLRSPEGEKP